MKLHPRITPEIAKFIGEQQVFHVATAPLAAEGHVNVSPKGGDAFRILGLLEAVYQDYTGSGAETAAHVRENGRITVLFSAFAGPPKIVRLHGQGTVVTPGSERYGEFEALFPPNAGTRETLDRWAATRTPEQMSEYRAEKNRVSIDGLPAL